ncbi:MAG: hypothetical protein ACLQVG_29275 [Terriglobia bacterium]
MKKGKLETATELANKHFAAEPYLKRIFLLEPVGEEDPNEPVKLLEVLEGALERGIEPMVFVPDPAHGIEYPVVIVEISPKEYEALRDGKLSVDNEGWSLGKELEAR